MYERTRARHIPQLAQTQRAGLIGDDGRTVARALAKVSFDAPMNAILMRVTPVEELAEALALGRREYCLQLEAGVTLRVCVHGSVDLLWRRRISLLRVLSGPVPSYCIGQAWHDLGI